MAKDSGSKSTALAAPGGYAIALTDQVTREFTEMVGGAGQLDVGMLPRVKVPAGGGLNWELPSGDAVKEIRGVLILRHAVRAYWKTKIDETGGGEPPDCSSMDGMVGQGNPGGDCATCPLNEWGSAGDGTNRKACRQITRMYFLRSGERLPTLLAAPPSAFQPAQRYVLSLWNEGVDAMSVETIVRLEPAASKGGVKYSRPTFTRGEALPSSEVDAIRAYAAQLIPALKSVPAGESESVADPAAA